MAQRYTYKSLVAEVAYINDQLKAAGIDWQVIACQRYEWTAVDYANAAERVHGAVHATLESGSPRQCAQAARDFMNAELRNAREKANATV